MPVTTYTTLDGEIVSENRGGTERDYVADALGSTVALLDSTQKKTDTLTYWPYGEVKTRTGTNSTPFQYVGTRGYYQDSSTKTYVRARYLDVQRGRWLTRDPIAFDSGSWNSYANVHNNPSTKIDPSGTSVYRCCAFGPSSPVYLEHCFVSTNLCGAVGIEGHVYPSRAKCRKDDEYLAPDPNYPPSPRRGPIHAIPGKGRPGWKVECWKFPNDSPDFERKVCECMKELCTATLYIFPFITCWTWPAIVFSCATQSPAPYPPV